MALVDVDGKIRVVAIDDHSEYLQHVRVMIRALAEDIAVVDLATSTNEGFEKVVEHLPDMVLMDINGWNNTGVDVALRIRERYPSIKIILLTTSTDPRDVYRAMRIGVNGYLSKDCSAEELISAVRAVQAGEIVLARAAAITLLGATPDHPPLTETELRILSLLGSGIGHHQVAKQLSISLSTLKRQLQSIQNKMRVPNRMQAIVSAAKRGLI